MKGTEELGTRFAGKEFWRTLNLVIFFIMYGVMFVVPVFFPDHIWTVAVICAFLIMIYITAQQFVYRKMERKNAGRRVLYGWIDEEEDMGEEYEIPVKKISNFKRLSESDQEAVDAFIALEKSKMSAIGLKESRIQEFINKGYVAQDIPQEKEPVLEIENQIPTIEIDYDEYNDDEDLDETEQYIKEEEEKDDG